MRPSSVRCSRTSRCALVVPIRPSITCTRVRSASTFCSVVTPRSSRFWPRASSASALLSSDPSALSCASMARSSSSSFSSTVVPICWPRVTALPSATVISCKVPPRRERAGRLSRGSTLAKTVFHSVTVTRRAVVSASAGTALSAARQRSRAGRIIFMRHLSVRPTGLDDGLRPLVPYIFRKLIVFQWAARVFVQKTRCQSVASALVTPGRLRPRPRYKTWKTAAGAPAGYGAAHPAAPRRGPSTRTRSRPRAAPSAHRGGHRRYRGQR